MTDKFIHPSHIYSPVVSNPFTMTQLGMNVLSQIMENSRKRSLQLPVGEASPSKRLREEVEDAAELRDRLQVTGCANGDGDSRNSLGSGLNNDEDSGSSSLVTRVSVGVCVGE